MAQTDSGTGAYRRSRKKMHFCAVASVRYQPTDVTAWGMEKRFYSSGGARVMGEATGIFIVDANQQERPGKARYLPSALTVGTLVSRLNFMYSIRLICGSVVSLSEVNNCGKYICIYKISFLSGRRGGKGGRIFFLQIKRSPPASRLQPGRRKYLTAENNAFRRLYVNSDRRSERYTPGIQLQVPVAVKLG